MGWRENPGLDRMQGTGSTTSRPAPPHPWWLRDLLLAFGFLTRMPITATNPDDRPIMRTAWCFPLVGAAVGAMAGLLLWFTHSIGLPGMACALLAIAGSALLTGALHEDGLADLADGFGGGHDKASKITIMRDSRIGAYGVLTLTLATGLKASAIATLLASGEILIPILSLIVAHAAARGLIVPVAAWLPTAAINGLGHLAGEPKLSTVRIAVLISAALLLVLLPVTTALASAAAACLAAAAIAALARHQIGGYTGDVLGAAEQAAETAILLTLAASAGV